jgi:predicted Zn-ribbon and HTH transcriptional regulator
LKLDGIVSIFPEGQISSIGVTQELSFSIAKLLRKAKVDIYLVKHHNAYLVNPPWSKKTFKGRIETTMKLIISKNSLLTMTERDIYDLIVKELTFNVSEFNQTHLYKYKVNEITNLESVIYQCPSCGYEGITSNYNHLQCPKCKSIFVYDEFGKISGSRLDDLYYRQVNTMKEKIDSSENFCIESDVRLESYRNSKVEDVGEGHLTLTKTAYTFHGMIDGVNTTISFDPKNIPTLPSDLGRNVQIYEGYQIYQFVFKDVKMPTMFVIASEYIHKLRINAYNQEEQNKNEVKKVS